MMEKKQHIETKIQQFGYTISQELRYSNVRIINPLKN